MDVFVRRSLSLFFIATALYVFIWTLGELLPILMPFIAAIIFAYLFNPLVDFLSKRGHVPRWFAISLVFVTIGLALFLILWFLVPLIWEQIVYIRANIPNAIQWINSTLRPWLQLQFHIETNRISLDVVTTWLTNYLQSNYSLDDTQQMITRLAQSGLSIIGLLSLAVLIPIVTFYFLLDWTQILERLRSLIPRRLEKKTIGVLRECDAVLGSFIKGQLLVMILLGVIYAVGLQLIGISVGLIIGITAGLLSIIPYMGFAIGLAAAVTACLFQYGVDWWHLGLVAAVFVIGQFVEGYILQPFLLGDRIGLSPVAVIFAVLAGAQLNGVLGMFLALPVAALLVVFFRHIIGAYRESHFYLPNETDLIVDGVAQATTPNQTPDPTKLKE